jgi:hypothetical protein
MRVYGGTGDPCAPKPVVCLGKPKHQMGVRISVLATEVLLLRHHVAHGAGFRQWQFFLRECGLDVPRSNGIFTECRI